MITAAPVKSMLSQNIWQDFKASWGLGSLTHSFLSLGSDAKIVNETSSTPLFINLVTVDESVIPFPDVYPRMDEMEN